MTNGVSYYQMTVRKNKRNVLTFVDQDVLFEARRKLKAEGFEIVTFSVSGYVVQTSVDMAINTAKAACW